MDGGDVEFGQSSEGLKILKTTYSDEKDGSSLSFDVLFPFKRTLSTDGLAPSVRFLPGEHHPTPLLSHCDSVRVLSSHYGDK